MIQWRRVMLLFILYNFNNVQNIVFDIENVSNGSNRTLEVAGGAVLTVTSAVDGIQFFMIVRKHKQVELLHCTGWFK